MGASEEYAASLRVGLDGSNERKVLAVRHALIMAGVPASRIQTGAYGDPQLRRDGRVASSCRAFGEQSGRDTRLAPFGGERSLP